MKFSASLPLGDKFLISQHFCDQSDDPIIEDGKDDDDEDDDDEEDDDDILDGEDAQGEGRHSDLHSISPHVHYTHNDFRFVSSNR